VATLRSDDRGIVLVCPSCGQKNRRAYAHPSGAAHCGKCKAPLPAPSAPVEIASSSDFDRLISGSPLPVVVDFWAAWCGPCRMVAPEIEKIAARRAGRWIVAKVDTDAVADLGDRLGIRSIPTLAVFAGGREVARTAGARPAADIEAFVERALST
jgi:thioredoxin 2